MLRHTLVHRTVGPALLGLALGAFIAATPACQKGGVTPQPEPGPGPEAPPVPPPQAPMQTAPPVADTGNTCTGAFPSYWQDPAAKFKDQWRGQTVSNAPPAGYEGPVFKLSDRYPRAPVDDAAAQPFRDAKYAALFAEGTPAAEREKLAFDYGWAVLDYIQAGNIGQPGQEDWDVCNNPVRPWFHIPFQTYDALSGREFTHGLTREAPVAFSVKGKPAVDHSTMWAIGVFNATAAYALGQVWQTDGSAKVPTAAIVFPEGSVIGKPLFNTSGPDKLPVLANMPAWQANISDPSFCNCKPASGEATCTMVEDSQQCPRSLDKYGPVRLLQFDFAVKDSRAPGTKWVFGTFVADGRRKAGEPNPWRRMALLGVMWGNDTPPAGQLAYNYPKNPRKNGFKEEVIFWDAVDELNRGVGPDKVKQPGHLGCNQRLNGPADNANSSCMSCHGTASVPDDKIATPPLLAQFTGPPHPFTFECVTPTPGKPGTGKDRTGAKATVQSGISFAAMDALYFANTPAGAPFNMVAQTDKGPVNPAGPGVPSYAGGGEQWISLDYSMQLSISLVQWKQWQAHKAATGTAPLKFSAPLPRRGERQP